jgi:hypothetical protein
MSTNILNPVRWLPLAMLVLAASSWSVDAAAQVFQELPSELRAHAVSDVGSIVVGGYYASQAASDDFGSEGGARWTPGAGLEVILEPVEYYGESPYFRAVSSDGSKMLFSAQADFGISGRYDSVTETMDRVKEYGDPVVAISADGESTASISTSGEGDFTSGVIDGDDTFHPIGLPFPGYYEPGGGGTGNQPFALSGDGSKAVGQTGLDDAFLWTKSGGTTLVALGPDAAANAISDNGSWVVGTRGAAGSRELFLYDEIDGLSTLESDLLSVSVTGITDDGETIALGADVGGGSLPYLWRKGTGLVSYLSILEDELGLDMTGWNITAITDMSSTGRFVLGRGVNPGGDAVSWLVDLPEPSTALLLGVGLGLALRRRRRR